MIDIDFQDEALQKALNKVFRQLSNTKPLMRQISGALQTKADMNIRMGTSAEDQPFIPLSALTIAQRTKQRKWPGRILQVQNNLNRSISTAHGDGYAIIGSNLPYARRQQLSDKRPPRRGPMLPARPYLPFTDNGKLQRSAEGTILRLVQNYLESQ